MEKHMSPFHISVRLFLHTSHAKRSDKQRWREKEKKNLTLYFLSLPLSLPFATHQHKNTPNAEDKAAVRALWPTKVGGEPHDDVRRGKGQRPNAGGSKTDTYNYCQK
jgi:hypothetical protein